MNVHKIIKNRNETMSIIEESLWKNISEKTHYKNLFIDKNYKDKKDLLGRYIHLMNGGDIFDLAISIRKIGIVKFYDIMKEELERADVKNQYLSSCDVEEQNKHITEENIKLDNLRLSFKSDHDIQSNYPAEIIILFKNIFENNLIKSQEDVIDYKLDKKVKYFFNRKSYLLNKNILKYYELYTDHKLFTNGDNLFDEYTAFIDFEKIVETKSLDIQRVKSNIQVAEDEIKIYEKDMEAMKNEFNLDAIKRTTIRSFIEYTIKENMMDYYLDIFENKLEDRELLKFKIVSDLRLDFYLKYNSRFEESNKYLTTKLNDMKNEFKKVVFASFEETDLPLFSNIGYFQGELMNRINKEKDIIKLLSKKDFINSYDFSELENNIISEMKKLDYKKGVYVDSEAPVDFNSEELEKYYQEIEAFIESFK